MIFLVEPDRTLGAADLVDIPHLAAGCDAAEMQRAHGSAFKAAHEMRVIIIGDRNRPVIRWPLLVNRLYIRAQRLNRTGQRQRGIDHVRRQIPHCAVRTALVAPGRRFIGIGKEILCVLAAEIGDLADYAGCDQLASKLRGRRADVVEAGHVDDA